MDFLDDIDIYPKLIVASTGLLAAFIKIRDSYSSIRLKQAIKLDLEIYELIRNIEDFENVELKESIEKNITKSLNSRENGLTNFLVGLVILLYLGYGQLTFFSLLTHSMAG